MFPPPYLRYVIWVDPRRGGPSGDTAVAVDQMLGHPLFQFACYAHVRDVKPRRLPAEQRIYSGYVR